MLSYEFFCVDEVGETHSIGIIPEGRKHTERITKESVMQQLGVLLGESIDLNHYFVTQVNIDEDTGKITRVIPLIIH